MTDAITDAIAELERLHPDPPPETVNSLHARLDQLAEARAHVLALQVKAEEGKAYAAETRKAYIEALEAFLSRCGELTQITVPASLPLFDAADPPTDPPAS